jgi:2-keto-4-pentenoate hydratase/2-oxohepta-3-ene-1,7-dioic acid hydratase in catechol pathway
VLTGAPVPETPGDLLTTGAPPGVGGGFKPPRYLSPDDVVEVDIEGVGVLVNPVVAEGDDGGG